jgi:CubicO group peptidase (beta-lactamase class C family)
MSSSDLSGTIDPRFQPLADVLGAQLASGYDLGASLAVAVDGELVVDCWGGWADRERTEPWEADTITNVWSTTKTMTALSALVLADQGRLDLDERVAAYWPEFAANAKQDVLVRHLLGHTSGVSGWEKPFSVEQLVDDEVATAHLAGQAPWWEPGTASGYHAMNQGHLVGEVIRRIDGRGLARFFAEEIAERVDADFTIGSPPENHERIAPVVPPPPPEPREDIDKNAVWYKTFTGPLATAKLSWSDEWRAAAIGAANGHGNARSVARAQAAVSNGGVGPGGVRLLSPATIERIFEPQADGIDLVIETEVRFGMGYALPRPDGLLGITDGRICYWGGWGGSIVVNDVDNGVTLAYVMNRMQDGILGNDTSRALVAAYLDLQ